MKIAALYPPTRKMDGAGKEINYQNASFRFVGFNCEGIARANSKQEVMQLAVEHAKPVHGVAEFTNEMAEKVKSVIHDE